MIHDTDSDSLTAFHITHQKAGSQWVRQVLSEAAPARIMIPQGPRADQFLHQPILRGMIYPAVFITREEFEAADVPNPHVAVIVMRDLRDTLVSAYFSFRFSHVQMHIRDEKSRRDQLNQSPTEDGLRYLMHASMPEVARMQLSWLGAGHPIVRYEELLDDDYAQFARILTHCGLNLSSDQIRRIVAASSFETSSGRQRGVEDLKSHQRKGVAGDWRNHLKGDLLAEFKEYFDDVLIETGYEQSRDWGAGTATVAARPANPIQRVIDRTRSETRPPASCWCGHKESRSFGPHFNRCLDCGTVFCTYPVKLDDLIVQDDEMDLYGRPYWLTPSFAARFGFGSDMPAIARRDLAGRGAVDRMRAVLRFRLPPGRVLDVGCGTGAFIALLRQAGFDATGLELSPWLVDFAKTTFGIPVVCGPLERQDFEPGSFDAIVLWDVLQHVPEPLDLLARCLHLLSDTGVVLVRSPFIDATRSFEELRAVGSPLTDQLRPIEHMQLFTASSMRRLFAKAGCGWMVTDEQSVAVGARTEAASFSEEQGTAALLASPSGRMVQALLDESAEIGLHQRRRNEDRLESYAQLHRTLTAPSHRWLQSDVITMGVGWHEVETYQGETFCWAANDAELIVHKPSGELSTLSLEVEPGPGLGHVPLALQIQDRQGRTVATGMAARRATLHVSLPIVAGQTSRFWLHVEGGGLPAPNDPRILNFRLFRVGWSAAGARTQRQG